MLQDLEAGRPMELEALVGSVVELGEKVGVAMNTTRMVYSCAKLLGQCGPASAQTTKSA
jgi:2-dehydropantoate 2-reductase